MENIKQTQWSSSYAQLRDLSVFYQNSNEKLLGVFISDTQMDKHQLKHQM